MLLVRSIAGGQFQKILMTQRGWDVERLYPITVSFRSARGCVRNPGRTAGVQQLERAAFNLAFLPVPTAGTLASANTQCGCATGSSALALAPLHARDCALGDPGAFRHCPPSLELRFESPNGPKGSLRASCIGQPSFLAHH